MSEGKYAQFISSFPEYLDTIEELRPLKRPMLLWSAVSLLYVLGGLQLSDNTISNNTTFSLWGFQIVGLTDTKLTIFFFLATLYYSFRWSWTTYLRLRTYKDEGFISMLWTYGMPQNLKEKEDGLEGHALRKGFAEIEEGQPQVGTLFKNEIAPIEDVRSRRGAINDLFDPRLRVRLFSYAEHIGIPYLLPPAIALTALIVLSVRLLGCA